MKIQPVQSAAKPWPTRPGARARGFTLIELIMVMVMLGVLAVFAAPRIFNSNDFYARGFHDETLGLLRYAQKTAIAQRRMVCVVFGANSATLAIDADKNAANGCEVSLPGPKGESSGPAISARGNVAYNGTPTGFNFDGLGQPVDSARVPLPTSTTIQVTNATNTIKIEASTGYAHD